MKALFVVWFRSGLVFGLMLSGPGMADEDPSYGTSNPHSYRARGTKAPSRFAYPSDFENPDYGTSNPPGYNQRKAQQRGQIYVAPSGADGLEDPSYGTSRSNRDSYIVSERAAANGGKYVYHVYPGYKNGYHLYYSDRNNHSRHVGWFRGNY